MIILALDTASVCVSCAVLQDTTLLGESYLNGGLSHSETMLCMIDEMLHNLSMSVQDVDMFAITTGPGSFTGVRIGVSLIKGMALASQKPCVGVSTLDVLAAQCMGCERSSIIVPVMDARRAQVYTALYQPLLVQGSLDWYLRSIQSETEQSNPLVPPHLVLGKCSAEQAISIIQLEEIICGTSAVPLFVGDGCDVVRKNGTLRNVNFAPHFLQFQHAYYVGLCALLEYHYAVSLNNQNIYTDTGLKPMYLRPSQAELSLQRNHHDSFCENE